MCHRHLDEVIDEYSVHAVRVIYIMDIHTCSFTLIFRLPWQRNSDWASNLWWHYLIFATQMHILSMDLLEKVKVRSFSWQQRFGYTYFIALHSNSFQWRHELTLIFKASHCCRPNVATSSISKGVLTFTALRDIDAGEEILPSYLIDLYTTPRGKVRNFVVKRPVYYC